MHGRNHCPGGSDPIPCLSTAAKWATGYASVSGSTLGNDKSLVVVDINPMATNAPEVFNLDTGGQGSVGLSILEIGVYRIWATMVYTSASSALIGQNFTGLGYINFVNPYGSTSGLNARGFNLSTDFAGSTQTQINLHYMVDFFYYSGADVVFDTPGNVIEFGLQQNTLNGGNYEVGFQIYQLVNSMNLNEDNDFADVTYLPPA